MAPVLAGAALLALGACSSPVMDPAGDVARQQRDLILISTGLMLLIIVPVMIATAVFAWRYRAANRDATYDPDFDHSTMLELGIWSAPLLIIICLGAITWSSTHLLDPYRPVDRLEAGRPVAKGVKPLEVQVVALDWKWLFIYPEQGIATVNELATPVNVPLHFRLTGTSVMNTFDVPTLAGMIYTMPGMETSLHAVLNRPGEYTGLSGNYSGAGFSDMHFRYHGLTRAGFDQWVSQIKGGTGQLDRGTFIQIEKPSVADPVRRFANVSSGLFDRVVGRCIQPNKPCSQHSMAHDQANGGGKPGIQRPGAGFPSINSPESMHEQKTPGALTRDPEDKGSAPRQPSSRPLRQAPGTTGPGHQNNRDFTFLTLPGRAAAALG